VTINASIMQPVMHVYDASHVRHGCYASHAFLAMMSSKRRAEQDENEDDDVDRASDAANNSDDEAQIEDIADQEELHAYNQEENVCMHLLSMLFRCTSVTGHTS
jgi:hypothetical protein